MEHPRMKLPIIEVKSATAVPAYIPFTPLPQGSIGKRYRLVEVTDEPDRSDPMFILEMIASRARNFPDFPMGYHLPEVFKAVGQEQPRRPDDAETGIPVSGKELTPVQCLDIAAAARKVDPASDQ
jgi:hypothetical protein